MNFVRRRMKSAQAVTHDAGNQTDRQSSQINTCNLQLFAHKASYKKLKCGE